MRVAVFPSDNGGCGFYRLRFVAAELQNQGHDITVADGLPGHFRDYTLRNNTTGAIRVDTRLEMVEIDAEVIVVQRITRDVGVEFVELAKAQGHRVVVDVDDDLDALHDGHPYIDVLNGEGRSPDNLHAVCQMADVVTVTTPALAERYGYGKAVVLPNLVPAEYLRLKARRKGPLRVGWTGRPISHLGDAAVMGRKVGPVVAAAGARFAAWGSSAPRCFAEVGVPVSAQVTVPHRPLRSGYPGSVAELSVGLVPLSLSRFNEAKSWLKGIEYASLGVPFVASPTPEYVKLAELGVGALASTPEEWAAYVAELLANDDLRRRCAEEGREAVSHLTYEAHAGRWWSAWTGTSADCESSATLVGAGAATSAPA